MSDQVPMAAWRAEWTALRKVAYPGPATRALVERLLVALETPPTGADLTLIEHPATDACATTQTPRFRRVCRCPTYLANWGACDECIVGSNGRCVFCDHEQACHRGAALEAGRVVR